MYIDLFEYFFHFPLLLYVYFVKSTESNGDQFLVCIYIYIHTYIIKLILIDFINVIE